MKALLLLTIAAILSVIVPASAYSQIADLNTSTATINGTAQNQCLDFNNDKVCEYIILSNGTQVANPLSPTQQQPPKQVVQNQTSETPGVGTSYYDHPDPTVGLCYDIGHDDGQNSAFDNGGCNIGDGSGAYYDGFIAGCMDADNTKRVCELATDAGDNRSSNNNDDGDDDSNDDSNDDDDNDNDDDNDDNNSDLDNDSNNNG